MLANAGHIGIVISRHQRNVVRRADAFQPFSRRGEFQRQRDVDEIAGDRDVAGMLRVHVGDEFVQHFAAMNGVALALPVHVADGALAGEVAQPRLRHRAEMRIGQVRKQEGCHGLLFGKMIDAMQGRRAWPS